MVRSKAGEKKSPVEKMQPAKPPKEESKPALPGNLPKQHKYVFDCQLNQKFSKTFYQEKQEAMIKSQIEKRQSKSKHQLKRNPVESQLRPDPTLPSSVSFQYFEPRYRDQKSSQHPYQHSASNETHTETVNSAVQKTAHSTWNSIRPKATGFTSKLLRCGASVKNLEKLSQMRSQRNKANEMGKLRNQNCKS